MWLVLSWSSCRDGREGVVTRATFQHTPSTVNACRVDRSAREVAAPVSSSSPSSRPTPQLLWQVLIVLSTCSSTTFDSSATVCTSSCASSPPHWCYAASTRAVLSVTIKPTSLANLFEQVCIATRWNSSQPMLRIFAAIASLGTRAPLLKGLFRQPSLRSAVDASHMCTNFLFFCCLLNNLLFLNVGPLFVCCNIINTLCSVEFHPVRWYPQPLVDILRINSCSLYLVVHLDVHVDLLFLLHLQARLTHERFHGDTHRLLQRLRNFSNLVDGTATAASRRFPVESTSLYKPCKAMANQVLESSFRRLDEIRVPLQVFCSTQFTTLHFLLVMSCIITLLSPRVPVVFSRSSPRYFSVSPDLVMSFSLGQACFLSVCLRFSSSRFALREPFECISLSFNTRHLCCQ